LHAFEGELKDGKINTGNNNLLRSHLLNVAVNIDMNDSRMKPVKYNKRAHIDGAVSVFDALAVKMKFHASIGKMLENNPS
jgi:phage terminase large subunit-like protein